MTSDLDLVGHWPLANDAEDHSPVGHKTKAVDVELGAPGPDGRPGAGRFNGRSSLLEVADHSSLHFGVHDFSVAAWVCADDHDGDVVGSILSKFDHVRRKGLGLYVLTSSGVTSTAQPNYRHVHFGIDDASLDPAWQDCGRPGNAAMVAALAVSDGLLYAGTMETGADEMGHVYRYDGGQKWRELGNPVGCNAVPSVLDFNGAVYIGTGRYICAGSALGPTRNTTPGGKVYRLEPDGRWVYCGHPGHEDATPEDAEVSGYDTGKADDIASMAVYRGDLYAVSNHRRGVFCYEGGEGWRYIGPDTRVLSLAVYHGELYALHNGGPVSRYEGGEAWADCGCPEGSTQTYSAVVYRGRLHVGTWPEGTVDRYEGGQEWRSLGRVAYEREIMGMALYNGKVYLGALPTGNVYRLDGDAFTLVGNLDNSPVVLRRVWSMTVFHGKLYAGTLPSGRVWSIEAGKMATCDRTFPPGWHHMAAVKNARRLEVYVDGKLAACSSPFHPASYNVTNDRPLEIGFGAFEHFNGLMSDVRLYARALSVYDVAELARGQA